MPRRPHKISATLKISQESLWRSKKMCPVSPSHTTSSPSSTKITSITNRSSRSGVSIQVHHANGEVQPGAPHAAFAYGGFANIQATCSATQPLFQFALYLK